MSARGRVNEDFTIRSSLDVEFTKAPAIAIAGPSGSGKTESAMRLARGWCDFFGKDERFVVIDTEEKRALYKKSRHQPWDWMDLQPPFTPERVWAALDAVKHYRAVILDSTSHEYAGQGGLQEIADEALERMAKGDPARMEALTAPSWKDAKGRHKRELMSNLIRYPTLVICCLRAEQKVKFTKVEKNGRMVNAIVDAGYQPICEKSFMFEMLASFLMYPDKAGVPTQVKALEEDLKPVFLLDGRTIDEQTGTRLAAWAAGRVPPSSASGERAEAARPGGGPTKDEPPPSSSPGAEPARVTAAEARALKVLCLEYGVPMGKLIAKGDVKSIDLIAAARFEAACNWIRGHTKPQHDEGATLRRIEAAFDAEEASLISESVRNEPFHAKALAAFASRWPEHAAANASAGATSGHESEGVGQPGADG